MPQSIAEVLVIFFKENLGITDVDS